MVRSRVLSFMSQLSSNSKPPTPSSSPPTESPLNRPKNDGKDTFVNHQRSASTPATPPSHEDYGSPLNSSPVNSPHRHKRSTSRPLSMVQTWQPLMMDVNEDTIPELQPIFSFLNSHSNKLYQEGYFLKLDDQNSQGKPNADRTWTECFAQLVGTVLSLWDAAELDAAGEDGEVLPKFLNLTDASIKMVESLPTRSNDEQPLQNILSISTAGRNRYLLHFSTREDLVEWTAGIRLAIYEHNTLQEAYTGALIAGKGKTVNNINVIMERSRFKTEEWVRVRFGAGVPWRRCWCVISPPDEKEFLKLQKDLKKRSPYDRSAVPVLKGDIKFYDTRKDGKKQKKAQPIATITDAYSAYAIYPQAKSLVDASTLLKIEGTITVHSEPATTNEGFVFIMPEVRPMVSGFEMLLRFLFPTWDAFGLYGRPGKLVASILDPRSLMFAMPKHRRYGYLEPQDVTALIDDASSGTWNEGEWRKRLKEATGTRMNNRDDSADDSRSRSNSRGSGQPAFGGDALGGRPRVGFTDDAASVRSRSQSLTQPNRTDSAPLEAQRNRHHPPMPGAPYGHARNTSDPDFGGPNQGPPGNYGAMRGIMQDRSNTMSSDEERHGTPPIRDLGAMRNLNTPEPVSTPPQFGHANGNPSSRMSKAYHSPELRRANSRLSNGTLHQLATAGGLAVRDGTTAGNSPQRRNVGDGAIPGPSVHPHAANSMGTSANDDRSREALRQPQQPRPPALNIPSNRSESPAGRSPYGPPSPYTHGPNSPALTEGRRSPFPPGPSGPPGGGPPRSPGFRPDQSRPPPQGRGGPGGPPSQGGRGRPPPNMNGPSPEYYGRGRGSPGPGPGPGPGPNPYSAPHGSQANPNARNLGLPDRSTSLNKHKSVTPNEIIDHYTSDGGYDHLDRPRAGVLKTVGGGETAPAPRQNFDIPDVDFGPTFNYGARQGGPNQRGPPPPGGPQPQRPYSPAGPRPSTAGRNSPANPPHQVHRRPVETASQRVPWQPGGPAPGPGANSVSPEQYVQQRAADNSHRRRSSHDLMNSGHVRHESADTMQRPSTSGGPLAERDAWATDHRHHQQPPAVPFGQQGMADRSMSPRPTTPGGGRGGAPYGGYNQGPRPGPQEGQPMRQGDPRYMPPQGQFSPAPPPHAGPRNVHPQYQGQAF